MGLEKVTDREEAPQRSSLVLGHLYSKDAVLSERFLRSLLKYVHFFPETVKIKLSLFVSRLLGGLTQSLDF